MVYYLFTLIIFYTLYGWNFVNTQPLHWQELIGHSIPKPCTSPCKSPHPLCYKCLYSSGKGFHKIWGYVREPLSHKSICDVRYVCISNNAKSVQWGSAGLKSRFSTCHSSSSTPNSFNHVFIELALYKVSCLRWNRNGPSSNCCKCTNVQNIFVFCASAFIVFSKSQNVDSASEAHLTQLAVMVG